MLCGGKPKVQEIDLIRTAFQKIDFRVNAGNLTFDVNEGNFKYQNIDSGVLTLEDENLTKEIESKKRRIEMLRKKIREVDEKHEQMMKILNIDVNEREYILEAKARCEKK
jgi:hypothetical protein